MVDTWNGSSDDWTKSGDWSMGTPVSTSDVVIASGGPQITSSVGTVATVNIVTSRYAGLAMVAGSLTTTGDFGVYGYLTLDYSGAGGSSLTIGGTLNNLGLVQIGSQSETASAQTKVKANALNGNGVFELYGGAGSTPTTLAVSSAAGFGTAGELGGQVDLYGNALIKFASGSITTLDGGLYLANANSLVADVGSTSTNSALTGLNTVGVGGELTLEDGSSITTTGDLSNSGVIDVVSGADGGSSLTVGGKLTNTYGNIFVQSTNSGSLAGGAHQATVVVSGGLDSGLVTGEIGVSGNALLEIGSTQLTDIAASSEISVSGPNAFLADAGATGSNSALNSLASNAGTLALTDTTVSTSGDFNNTGTFDVAASVDGFTSAVGTSNVTLGGVLTNSGTTSVSGAGQSTLTVNGIANTGTLKVGTASSIVQTGTNTLAVKDSAGFGTRGVLTGLVNVTSNQYASSLITFTDGSITRIDASGTLQLLGASSFIADTGSASSDSALTGLISNAGNVLLEGGTSLTTTGDFDNSGTLTLSYGGGYGASLMIGGALTDDGAIYLSGATMSSAATLVAPGGLSSGGVLSGTMNLSGYALLQLGSSQLTSVAVGGDLEISGPNAFVADSNSTSSNSALTGLASNAGTIRLTDGVSITTTGALDNSGTLYVNDFVGTDGSTASTLTIGGTLTDSGAIYVNGTGGDLATLSATGGLVDGGVLTGLVSVSGNALLEVASSQVTDIASSGTVDLSGPMAFIADANATTSNSALAGLASNEGTFSVIDDTVTTSQGLNNSGSLSVTSDGTAASSVTIGGTLTNSSMVTIGDNNGASTSAALTVAGLNNQSGGTVFLNGNGVLDVNGPVINNGTFNSTNGTVNLTANINDLGSLITGTGTITGTMTVQGSLEVGTGTLTIKGSLTGNGTIAIDSSVAALAVNESSASTFSGTIQDGTSGTGGNLLVSGLGALTLTGQETYTGKTSISGTLALSGSASIQKSTKAALTTAGATFDISGETVGTVINKLGGIAGTLAYLGSNNLKIKVQAGLIDTFAGAIKDGGIAGGAGGGLELGGLGMLNLTGADTYTGATKLDAGTLALTGSGSIAQSSQLSLAAPATFDVSGETAAAIGALIGGGGAIDLGAGTLTVNEATASTFAGTIQNGGASGGTGGSLVVAGSNALTLTGANSYTGKTSVSGTLDLSGSGSVHSSTKVALTKAGATLDISGATVAEVVNKLGGIAGTITDLGNQNLKIKVQAGTVDTFSGSIQDGGVAGGSGGSVTLGGQGELSLAGANSYTGGTTLDAGTLDLAALGAAGMGTITFANPASNGVATLEIDAAALSGGNGTYSFANAIAGATTTNQVIDLRSLAYVQGSTTATLNGTSLSVTDGTSNVTLHLAAAQSKSSFTTASDGQGGTLVYDPPATTKHAPATAKIDTSWIEMAMSNSGGVTGGGHAHAAMHHAYALGADAAAEHHHAHLDRAIRVA